MLTLTFLGVGNAFAKRNLQSNALVEAWSVGPDRQPAPDAALLIDLGTTGPQALHQLKAQPGFGYLDHAGIVDYRRIGSIFTTHQHSDHIGGLEELALMNTFAYGGPPFRPRMISSAQILDNLWAQSLQGGLGVLQGRRAGLEDYFDPKPLSVGPEGAEQFPWTADCTLEAFPTDHVRLQHKYDWPSLGVVFRDRVSGASAFFSGDTGFNFDAYAERMGAATCCFHEVHLGNEALPVHSSLEQMRTLPPEIKRKTHLYHYGDDWDSGAYAAAESEFAGFARPLKRYVLWA
ncbi:MAG: MBL fold metallo-hydrolase [bacterium]|nr:MBL fold metallo-hydrolase [bacterium]